MSLYSAAQMGQQLGSQQQPGGVATGHVPQQPNLGLGPNRYVPPTFNWGRGGLDGRQPNYNQMDWNQMQAYYMPQHQNSPFTSGYMGQLQQMLGQFGGQYGGPNRMPILPQFGSYNPGFGGPTSFFDQMQQERPYQMMFGGGTGEMMQNPYGFGGNMQGIMNARNQGQSGMMGDYVGRGGVGGGGRSPYGSYEEFEQAALASGRQPGQYMTREQYGDGGMGGRDPIVDRGFGNIYSGDDPGYNPNGNELAGGNRGPQMPQFNPYMLARNNMMGMDFNQMFDPRYAMLFGMGGLGAMRPQGFEQGPPSTANGQKPMMTGGGG